MKWMAKQIVQDIILNFMFKSRKDMNSFNNTGHTHPNDKKYKISKDYSVKFIE